MTRTCFLHIGLPKTGSSSIQRSLYLYADARIEYGRFPKPNHSAALLYAFGRETDEARLPPHMRARSDRKNVTKSTQAVRNFGRVISGSRDVILSGEYISGRLSKSDLQDLNAALKQQFDQVRVICYLRPYLELAASSWQQRVKAGLDRLVVPCNIYRPRIEPVMEVFGTSAMEFGLFDRGLFPKGDIVADFCRRVGIDESLVESKRVNESLSLEATAVIMANNAYELTSLSPSEHLDDLRELPKILSAFGQQRVGFSKALLDEGLEKSADDIAWAEDLTGFRLRGRQTEVDQPIVSQSQLLALAAEHAPAARELIRKVKSKEATAKANKVVSISGRIAGLLGRRKPR